MEPSSCGSRLIIRWITSPLGRGSIFSKVTSSLRGMRKLSFSSPSRNSPSPRHASISSRGMPMHSSTSPPITVARMLLLWRNLLAAASALKPRFSPFMPADDLTRYIMQVPCGHTMLVPGGSGS